MNVIQYNRTLSLIWIGSFIKRVELMKLRHISMRDS